MKTLIRYDGGVLELNIYMIRHGEKTDDSRNHGSLELTAKGHKQAELLGMRLQSFGIEKIYTSNMVRAVQTSEDINRYIGAEIVEVPGLREINMGICETEGWSSLEEKYPDYMKEFRKHETDMRYPPDGECGADVWKRSEAFLQRLVGEDLNNVAIVTHGGFIRITVAGILKLDQTRRFYLGSPLKNCSITSIKYSKEENEFYIQSFNDYAHLQEKDNG